MGISVRRDEIAHARARGGLVAPVDRHKQRARLLAVVVDDLHDAGAVGGGNPRQATVGKASRARILRMNFHERLAGVHGEARASPRARHCVPLIADAAGVEAKRIARAD